MNQKIRINEMDAYTSDTKEAETIQKKRTNPKSHTSRENEMVKEGEKW